MKIIIAYIPVLHKGYLNFFEEFFGAELYIIGEELIAEFPEMDYIKRKDFIRALSPGMIKKVIESLGIFHNVEILDSQMIQLLQNQDLDVHLIAPDEDISRAVVGKYFNDTKIEFRSIFLRWHRDNVVKPENVKARHSFDEFDLKMMRLVFNESQKSGDWWRQVGGVIVKNDEPILIAVNQHAPDKQMPYVFGDPRSIFKKGIHLDLSTAEHSEAILIAEAARRGITLEGSSVYTTDFPCPPCAKLIARSGIKKCYFSRGYSILDGESILKKKEVEIIFIDLNPVSY